MANPTKLTWRHDGKNTDGSIFDASQFGGWELEINGELAVSVPIGWSDAGVFELPLIDLEAIQVTGDYTLRMRLRHKNGNVSDWSEPASFSMDFRKPERPFGLSAVSSQSPAG